MRKLEPTASFQLRKMTPEDLPAVHAMEARSFKSPWSLELLRRELTHQWSSTILAEEPDGRGGMKLLGCLIFWLVHDELHILNVAVDPPERRRGVGRTLISYAMEQARAHRCALATLEVRRGNVAAIELYRSFGFEQKGVRPNYYAEEGADAIIMTRSM